MKEIKQILYDVRLEICGLDELNIADNINETGKSFEENAILKAKQIGINTGFLTLADDSGLEIDALGGQPGIRSARYAQGSDLDRINKVLEQLKDVPQKKRKARFKAVIAIYDPPKNKTYAFEGESEGLIIDKPLGDSGFGYDPIFYNLDLGMTNGQATAEEKNRASHRARALLKAKKILKSF